MSRGRKSFSSSINDNWEKAFFNSIGLYITLINKGLSKLFKSEPLSNHIKIVGGFAFKNAEYKSSGIPIIRISDFNNERIVLDNVVYYEESPLLEKYELKESDIIIALTGGTIGKLGIVQAGLGKLYLNQRVGKFDILSPDEFEKEYIYWIARGVESIVKNLAWGAAIPNVSPKQIEDLNFPIPTKNIQKSIIRFLNDLKNASAKDEIYFDEVIENEIKDIQEKQVKAREIQDELSYQLTQLDNLNQAILQEAVQGKLVPQDPNDEAASELLKRIKAEKAKSGKKEKPLPPIKPEEIPFEIPENWVWCRLGEICEVLGGFAFDSTRYSKVETQNQVIRLGNVKPNQLVLETSPVFIDDKYALEAEKSALQENDILITMTGTKAKRDYLFSLCLKSGDLKSKRLFLNQRVGCFRFDDSIFPDFINFALKDLSLLAPVFDSSTGAANQANIGMTALKEILIPLPPLSEQKRIVAEIERQFAKTNQLKEHIIANQQATEQLLKALLHQAFEVEEMETDQ